VPAIFAEKLHATADADALGDRLGVEVVELYTDALGEPGSGADTYPGLLRTDAARIAAALGA
jgi:ABC-type Zn uptake system ZnuABC Zn-binding protein ZnuA